MSILWPQSIKLPVRPHPAPSTAGIEASRGFGRDSAFSGGPVHVGRFCTNTTNGAWFWVREPTPASGGNERSVGIEGFRGWMAQVRVSPVTSATDTPTDIFRSVRTVIKAGFDRTGVLVYSRKYTFKVRCTPSPPG